MGIAGNPPNVDPDFTSFVTPERAASVTLLPNFQMTRDANLTRQDGKISNFRAAGNSNLAHDDATTANFYVVADLDEIVDFRSCANNGIRASPSIDGSVGSNIDVVFNNNPTKLGDPLVPLRSHCEPKSILPQTDAGMDCHRIADQTV